MCACTCNVAPAGACPDRLPGLLLVGDDLRVEWVTATGRRWLAELGFVGDPAREPLPAVLSSLAARVRSSGREETCHVVGGSGACVQVHGSPTPGELRGRVALILHAPTAANVGDLPVATPDRVPDLTTYGLTRREAELAELVLLGCDTGEIAAQMFISPHTVQGHLKAIFAKVGVRSRRQLMGWAIASSREVPPELGPLQPRAGISPGVPSQPGHRGQARSDSRTG